MQALLLLFLLHELQSSAIDLSFGPDECGHSSGDHHYPIEEGGGGVASVVVRTCLGVRLARREGIGK